MCSCTAFGSSSGRVKSFAVRPCLRALRAERFLPSSVFGPVECFAFCRLARSCFSLQAMVSLSQVGEPGAHVSTPPRGAGARLRSSRGGGRSVLGKREEKEGDSSADEEDGRG